MRRESSKSIAGAGSESVIGAGNERVVGTASMEGEGRPSDEWISYRVVAMAMFGGRDHQKCPTLRLILFLDGGGPQNLPVWQSVQTP